MTAVLDARKHFEQAQEDAKASVDRARAQFGKTIKDARRAGAQAVTQDDIAKALELTREQVRRYERFYEQWAAEHGEP